MAKLYLIYGDYEEGSCVNRCDYKVLAFRRADSSKQAFSDWLEEQPRATDLLEDEIIIREVGEEKTYHYIGDSKNDEESRS